MHILKLSTWQIGNKWYVGDIEDLGHGSGTWWYIPQALDVPYEKYPHLLKDEYNATLLRYHAKENVFIFAFEKYADANRFKNYVNKKARDKHFMV